MSTAKHQQASSTSQRKWLSPLPVLAGWALLQMANGGLPAAVAQPPESRANDIAYLVPEIDAEWQRLRAEMGLREFTAPRETITRYQQFFEQKGVRSAATSVKITGVIAQIYWQQLKDRKKALEIYNWALEKYAGLPIVENLRRGRDMVANASSSNDTVNIAPIVISGQDEGKAIAAGAITFNSPQAGAKPGAAPVTVGNSFTPITVASNRGQEGRGLMPVLPSVVATAQSTELLPEVVLPLSTTFGGSLASMEVSVVGNVGQNIATSLSAVNPRLAALNGYLAQWREGRMSWGQLVKDSQFRANDVVLLTSQPGLISMYRNDVLLRKELGQTMRSFPELQQDWEKLPPTAQVILADDCVRQKNPLAKTIYESLIQLEKMPNGVWWNKERLTYRVGLYHVAMGDYVKAAESNLEIVAFTKSNAWHDDSIVEAARSYIRAGKEEKAYELYRQVIDKGTYDWGIGVAIYDLSLRLITKGKYADARKILRTHIEGSLADQGKVGLLSLLGYSYFLTEDFEEAQKYSMDAVALYGALRNPLKGENLEVLVEGAKDRIRVMAEWKGKGFEIPLKKLLSKLDQGGVYHAKLYVHSFQKWQLSVDFKDNAAQLVALTLQDQKRTDSGIMVTIYDLAYRTDMHSKNLQAQITTSSSAQTQNIEIWHQPEDSPEGEH